MSGFFPWCQMNKSLLLCVMAPRMRCSFHYLWRFHSNEAGEAHTQTAGGLAQPSARTPVCMCVKVCWAVVGGFTALVRTGTRCFHPAFFMRRLLFRGSPFWPDVSSDSVILMTWWPWKPTLLVHFGDLNCTVLSWVSTTTQEMIKVFSRFVDLINCVFLLNFPACVRLLGSKVLFHCLFL